MNTSGAINGGLLGADNCVDLGWFRRKAERLFKFSITSGFQPCSVEIDRIDLDLEVRWNVADYKAKVASVCTSLHLSTLSVQGCQFFLSHPYLDTHPPEIGLVFKLER